MILHAGLIAGRIDGAWRGALVMGPSGSGKSDLMLRAIGLGLRLVADDRTLVWTSGSKAFGRAPSSCQLCKRLPNLLLHKQKHPTANPLPSVNLNHVLTCGQGA